MIDFREMKKSKIINELFQILKLITYQENIIAPTNKRFSNKKTNKFLSS